MKTSRTKPKSRKLPRSSQDAFSRMPRVSESGVLASSVSRTWSNEP